MIEKSDSKWLSLATAPILGQPLRNALWILFFLFIGIGQVRADAYDLVIEEKELMIGGRVANATVINGSLPGPMLRLKEGREVTLNVSNKLKEDTSLHWHGLIVPYTMDGVPGVSFDGIPAGESFTYRFKIKQSGTYWYHSHSGLQEQTGVYAPIVIEPAGEDPVQYDREYVVMLSDWTFEDPHAVLAHLKKDSGWYNRNRPTAVGLFKDLWNAKDWAERKRNVKARAAFARMRMDPTDISDVSGYLFLVNGRSVEENWTALFQPGERVRLRFINGAASTYFDVKIPGLKMTVVQADGQNVQAVEIDQFSIAVSETYDVIVSPPADKAYTIFAQAADRSGYARATLATRRGQMAPIPTLDERPRVGLDVMHRIMEGSGGEAMDHSKTGTGADMQDRRKASREGMDHAHVGHGMGAPYPAERADLKVLRYEDLKSLDKTSDTAPPDREIMVRLTGNMERYFWSFDDTKYSMSEPITFYLGERVRLRFVNQTMMNHPIHLHGLWQILRNGQGDYAPRKHVVNVSAGETVTVDVPVDNPGQWALHCHILYHMDTGMFREVTVE